MPVTLDIEKIEKKRIVMGLTKQELARRAGISPARYTQIIADARDGKPPFAPTIKEIATVLKLSMKEVLLSAAEVEVA